MRLLIGKSVSFFQGFILYAYSLKDFQLPPFKVNPFLESVVTPRLRKKYLNRHPLPGAFVVAALLFYRYTRINAAPREK